MIASRRGMSLTELLVVMTACSALLTLSSSLVCRVMRVHVDARTYDNAERNATRLADNFRRDVHRTQSVAPGLTKSRDPVFLQLEFSDGGHAKYSWQDGTVLREESSPDGPASREEFELPASCDLTIEEFDAPRRVVLTLSSDLKTRLQEDSKVRPIGQFVPVNLQVEAVVGRDARLTASPVVEGAVE